MKSEENNLLNDHIIIKAQIAKNTNTQCLYWIKHTFIGIWHGQYLLQIPHTRPL